MDLLIGDIFRNAAAAVPDRQAAVLGEASLTFAELDRGSNRLARALEQLGVAQGDRVAVWSATTLELVPLFASLAKLGAVFAPLNASLNDDEVKAMVESAAPALLVVDGARIGRAPAVASAAGASHISLADLSALAAHTEDGELAAGGVSESDPHVVFFTSGSTGRPKGAVLSHRVNYLRSHPGALPEPRGTMVCPYPLFHMGAWTIALQQWQARDGVIFLESADAAAICEAVSRHRATRLNCIPAVWRRILEHLAGPGGRGGDLSSVRFADTGTSATPLELLEAIEAVVPQAHLRVFYGSTEAGCVAALDHADMHRKPGSCGPPAPASEVRVDAHGELWVRGPLLFDGYLGDPAATADVLVDGWYRTGDVAELDPDGYLTIVGRTGDVIRSGGETVSPAEVEAALADHPAVADLAVVGIPDLQWGELVCVVVVVRPGSDPPTLADLRVHCTTRLAPYKHPRRIVIVGDIPRTPATRQVQRVLLAERIRT